MKKIFCTVIVLIFVLSIIPIYASAYEGGPLNDTSTNANGEIIFTEGNNVAGQNEIVIFNDALNITKDPGGENKKAGEECAFTVNATGFDTVTWYVITPNGKTYPATEVPNLYKGVSVGGTTTTRFTLYNITSEMSGCRFYAAFTGGDITMNTAAATLTVEGSVATATPAPTPTTTPAPTPTPVASTHVQGTGGQQGTVYANGNTSMMGTNTQNYNENVSIGNDGSASEPTATGVNNLTANTTGNTQIDNSRGNTHVGAYVLATIAGLVIVGSILIMVLYMKGKISLGKFEKFLGNSSKSPDMFDESEEFYNSDKFNDTQDY